MSKLTAHKLIMTTHTLFTRILTVLGILMVALLIAVIATVAMRSTFASAGVSGQGSQADACVNGGIQSVATDTLVTIGNQFTTKLVGTSSNRAFVRIQNIINATNSVQLILNDTQTTSFTTNGSEILTAATTTSPVTALTFGLNTNFPYTGAIRAITNAGSTTVQVTVCNY